MKEYSEKLSSLLDNELDDEQLLDSIVNDQALQEQFSRYQMIGDVMREEVNENLMHIDVTEGVMAAIQDETPANIKVVEQKNNVVPFMKRFGQYAIAASVAGIAVMGSIMLNNSASTADNPVLNTVPLGGTTPVSLEAKDSQTEQQLQEQQEQQERLEALLKDHQLQLERQP